MVKAKTKREAINNTRETERRNETDITRRKMSHSEIRETE